MHITRKVKCEREGTESGLRPRLWQHIATVGQPQPLITARRKRPATAAHQVTAAAHQTIAAAAHRERERGLQPRPPITSCKNGLAATDEVTEGKKGEAGSRGCASLKAKMERPRLNKPEAAQPSSLGRHVSSSRTQQPWPPFASASASKKAERERPWPNNPEAAEASSRIWASQKCRLHQISCPSSSMKEDTYWEASPFYSHSCLAPFNKRNVCRRRSNSANCESLFPEPHSHA